MGQVQQGRVRSHRAHGCMLGCLGASAFGLERDDEPRELSFSSERAEADHTLQSFPTGQLKARSELIITLARSIVTHGSYHPVRVREEYKSWLRSEPCEPPPGLIGRLLSTHILSIPDAQTIRMSSDALTRIIPLGIFGACGAR